VAQDYPRSWNFNGLPENYKELLVKVYGVQPTSETGYVVNFIAKVRELDAREQKFFSNRQFISAGFTTQTLYKLNGSLVPIKFNVALHRLIERNDILRTNYCSLGNKALAVVFDKRSDLPEVVYRSLAELSPSDQEETLRKIMEADMRKEFDPIHGNLIRFAIFRTGMNEYAVLVTAVRLIWGGLPIHALFASALGMEAPAEESPNVRKSAISDVEMEAAIRNYWSGILTDLPPKPVLPMLRVPMGATYFRKVYRVSIPPALMADLRQKAKSNKLMLISLLQTAWGFLLQQETRSHDIVFCSLAADRGGATGAMNVFPVRLKYSGASAVDKIAATQFKQLVVSQPYSSLDWDSMEKIFPRGRKDIFDHFLSFYDFSEKVGQYSHVEGKYYGQVVEQNSWDTKGAALGVYFHYGENRVTISFVYDENRFLPEFGAEVAAQYLLTLQQMLTDWNLEADKFSARLAERRKSARINMAEQDRARAQQLMYGIAILQGVEGMKLFEQVANFVTLFEGDRLTERVLKDNLVFVGEGRLARSIENNDGWYETLDVVKDGSWVNESVMLPGSKIRLSVEVLTEQATIILLPLRKMNSLLEGNLKLRQNIFLHVLRQMEKYQKLWLMA